MSRKKPTLSKSIQWRLSRVAHCGASTDTLLNFVNWRRDECLALVEKLEARIQERLNNRAGGSRLAQPFDLGRTMGKTTASSMMLSYCFGNDGIDELEKEVHLLRSMLARNACRSILDDMLKDG